MRASEGKRGGYTVTVQCSFIPNSHFFPLPSPFLPSSLSLLLFPYSWPVLDNPLDGPAHPQSRGRRPLCATSSCNTGSFSTIFRFHEALPCVVSGGCSPKVASSLETDPNQLFNILQDSRPSRTIFPSCFYARWP